MASTAAPPAGTKDGVDIAAAASGAVKNGGGETAEETEGEDDAEPCPKVTNASLKKSAGLDGALRAQRSSPYVKHEEGG